MNRKHDTTVAMALLAGLAGIGCNSLPDLEPEGCGNLVINADEDCDGFSRFGEGTSCGAPDDSDGNACFYVCTADSTCPEGWGCGVDGRCRQPSATFEAAPGSPYRFRVGELTIGDLDGDGFGDLVGSNVATIDVRFGGATGELSDEVDFATRAPTGPVTFGHLDGDALLDVVVPISGGVFSLLGQSDRTLEPVAYAPIELEGAGIARIAPLEAVDDGDSEILLVRQSLSFLGETGTPLELPAGNVVADLTGEIPRARLEASYITAPGADDDDEFALAFVEAKRVFVYTTTHAGGDAITAVPYQIVDLPGTHEVRFGARFADVDGDGWHDLLISTAASGQSHVLVSYNETGTLAAPVLESVFDRGLDPWPLAADDLDGDDRADYVFSDAITLARGTPGQAPDTLTAIFEVTTEPWVGATFVDINADGQPDVAAHVEAVDGIELFLNTGAGLFNRFHIDTDDPPDLLCSGDFDGDLVPDLAFKENVASVGGLRPNRISVVFGSRAGTPSEPVSMGSLGIVGDLEPMASPTDGQSRDLITDLVLVSRSLDFSSVAVAILQGDSARRMLSPFALQPGAGAPPDVPERLLLGRFAGDDDIADIIAVARSGIDVGAGDPLDRAVHVWVLPGKIGDGSLDASAATFITWPAPPGFELRTAAFATGELDADSGRDDLVFVDTGLDDQQAPVTRLHIGRLDADRSITTETIDLPAEYRNISDVELADLDGDGDLDVLALFGGEGAVGVSGAAVLVAWNDAGSVSASRITVIEPPGAGQLFDVATAQLEGAVIPELVLLGAGGLYTTRLDPETGRYEAPVLRIPTASDGRMATGDVNGDGLDDIAFTVGVDVRVALQLPAPPLGSPEGKTTSDVVDGAGEDGEP